MTCDAFWKRRAKGSPNFSVFVPRFQLFRYEARIGVEKWDREVCPQSIAVKIGNVQIIPGSLIRLPLKGTARIFAAVDKAPLFVFDRDLMWCEHETLILPDQVCDQTFLVKSALDSN